MKKSKLAVTAFFLAFAVVGFTFSGGLSGAQSKSKNDKDPALLSAIAGYKGWKEIRKPSAEAAEGFKNGEPMMIENSALAG